MTNEWVPFGLDPDEAADYQVLVTGVPTWLTEPIIGWLGERWNAGGNWYHTDRVLAAQTALRLDLGARAGSSLTSATDVRRMLRTLVDRQLLQVVDYCVSIAAYRVEAGPAVALEALLAQARSAYTVGRRIGKVGLVERVPEGVRVSTERTITESGTAGSVLARAWAHVHGLDANDTAGYADAVRAVEIAAIGLVQPGNDEATLGSVISQMREQGDWRLPLREHSFAPSAELLVQLLRTLYRGHRDRHGRPDYSDVTHEEARAAVVLGATLVDWFSSGAVARRPAQEADAS